MNTLEEAHKIGDAVQIIGGAGKGIAGTIGEIRHGAYKSAPKTYTVFHGESGAIQVPKEHIKKVVKESEELDEKTLTPNELSKKEEILKSLKKKQADFVKRYGRERAAGIMHATATNVAKAVTEEEIVESDSAIDGGAQGPIARASAKHGRIKSMMGTKTLATKIATILAKKE